jgi:uncharacterized RmlC-like cupin family protein
VIGHHVTPIPVGDRIVALDVVTPAGVPGPPPHHHEDCTEFFYVISGRFGVFKDGEWSTHAPGEYVEVPRGVVHTFRNDGAGVTTSRATMRSPTGIGVTWCPITHLLRSVVAVVFSGACVVIGLPFS